MLQNDTQSGAGEAGAPIARADVDALPAGSMGPETGNVISGAGTLTGSGGADTIGDPPGAIVAVSGAGGEVASASGGPMQVEGQYGVLTINADGSYSYVRSASASDGVQDVFTYTLADADGDRSSSTLTIQLPRDPNVEAGLLPNGPEGVVMLPAGVELSDIRVVGRDLVIRLPDGSEMVIPGGAVFVPQLVIGDVEVPPQNLAALLIESEPQPAAGTPQSSGGNFTIPVGPLDPGIPLGDLLPPTELAFTPPTFEEVGQFVDRKPTVIIETPDNPAGASNALATVREAGLPARGSEPPGSDSSANSEFTSGTIVYSTPDGFTSVTVNGIPAVVGTVITTAFGRLTITGINNGTNGSISYTYELLDNSNGDNTTDVFTVTVTDRDGDTATATLTVSIVDDVPTARADTDSIAAGDFAAATGNVMTGEGTTSGSAGADTSGADGAAVTAISGAGGSDSTFSEGLLQIAGQYGVLTMDAQGNYTYVRNPGTPGGVTDTFNYTITDGDGDTSSATLTISIGDLTPQTGQNATVLLDDDALPGGNPGGTGDDADAVNTSGTLAASGGDGALSFALLTTGAPEGFTYVAGPGGSLLVQQGGTTVLTVTVNAATGAYSVTQNAAIRHPDGSDENNVSFTVTYRVTDADGDTADGSLTINVDDDTPVITRADVSAPTLTVDESDLATDASADFSGLFSISYGADGAGAASFSLAVVNGMDSGLVDVETGEPILLFDNDGTIEGRVGGEGGAVAFTVTVTSSGTVTLNQVRALSHPDASNADDAVSPADGSIQLTLTATDADGDAVSETVDIGSSLVFRDDGPSVTVSADQPTLTVDETALGTNATASFAGVFAPVFGADGAGSVSYSLGINAGATGLVDTASGEAVVLVNNGGVIEGRTESSNALVFTVSVDGDGNVTLDQIRAVVHADASDHDDAATLAADNLITLTATVTDRDGDSASATANIGQNLVFEDDGPSIGLSGQEAPTLTVDESNLAVDASASFAGAFSIDFGADGAGSVGYALTVADGTASGLIDVATGQPILLFGNNGVIEGRVGSAAGAVAFTVAVNGSGVVTLDQIRAVQHPDGTSPDDAVSLAAGTVTLTATVTDGDGDTASASLDIGASLVFRDDAPSVNPTLSTSGAAIVDESAPVSAATIDTLDVVKGDDPDLAGELAIGSGTTAGPVINAGAAFGADGPAASGSLTYALTVMNPASGVTLTDGSAINLVQLSNGVVVGVVQSGTFAGQAAFAIQINPATGQVIVEQYLSLDHPANPDPNDPLGLAAGSLGATVTATDADGDSVTSTAVDITSRIVFLDDGPTAQNEPQQDVAEGGSISGQFDFTGGADGASVTHVNGVALVFGPDGFSQSIAVDDGTIKVRADGSYVFTAESTGSGVTSGTFTVTDNDGDPVTASWAFNITDVNVPTANPSTALLDDDGLTGGNPASTTGDLNANAGEVAPVNPSEAVYHGQLNFSFGGDGAGSINFAAMHGTSGTVGTETVNYSWNAATLTLTATGPRGVLFTLTLDDATSGKYTLTLRDNVLHQAGGDENDAIAALTFTVLDSDGSPASSTLTITFDDDAPTLNVTAGADSGIILTTQDADTIGANSDTAQSTANFSGVFGLTFAAGADGAATPTLSYSLGVSSAGANSGLTQGGAPIFLHLIGGKVIGSTSSTPGGVTAGNTVFDVSVSTTGVVTLTQYSQLDHPAEGTTTAPFDDQFVSMADGLITLTASSTITDGDGDSASDSETIGIGANLRFADDGPTVSGATAGAGLVVDETTAGTPAGFPISATTASAAITATTAFGADGAGSVTYGVQIAGGAASLLTSLQTAIGDHPITLVQTNATTITGTYQDGGTKTAFTIVMNANGTITYTQFVPLEHSTDGSSATAHNDSLTPITFAGLINATITVTDSDGDTASASVAVGHNLQVFDDGPSALAPEAVSLVNESGESVTGNLDLDGEVLANFGADGPGTITFANITNGMNSGFTSNDDPITLWLSADGQTLQGRVDSTNGTDGSLVFTVQINQADATYTFSLQGTIDNGSGVSFSNLTSTSAGNVQYRGVGANNAATEVDLLLSASAGGSPATVNTDNDSIGAANQSMDAGETVRIDFVSNLTSGAATPTGFGYTGHVSTRSFIGEIPQVQGNQAQTVSFTVYALDTTLAQGAAPDRTPGNGISDSTITTITEVTVRDYLTGASTTLNISGVAAGTTVAVAYGISVTKNADGSVTFSGVQEGDSYGFSTGSGDFNAVLVAAHGSFDLGVFSIGSIRTGDPVNLAFDLQITDSDGDFLVIDDAIRVTAIPEGTTTLSTMAVSQEADDSSTLLASESSEQQLKTLNAANTNAVFLGAIAAAGLSAEPAAASSHEFESVELVEGASLSATYTSVPSGSGGTVTPSQLDSETREAVADEDGGATSGDSGDNPTQGGNSLSGSDAADGPALTQLSQGSEAPANASADPSSMVANTVAMPSAEALAEAFGGEGVEAVQRTGEVERVLADALSGGEEGQDIQGMLDALPQQAAPGESAGEATASHVPGDVSAWDNGALTHFAAGGSPYTMEALALHQDAAPAA